MDRRILVPISSLIEAIASTTKACLAVHSQSSDIARSAVGAGESCRRFTEEIRSLKNALDAVTASTNKIAKLPSWLESENDKETWTPVYSSVTGCGQYLRELMPLLLDIQKSNDQSASVSLEMRAKRARMNQEDFDIGSVKIGRYTKKLQLALTMINL